MGRLLLSAGALRFLDSFVLIAPFYTVMFAEGGLSPAQIGVVMASWSVMCVILEVPCGVLADRMSRPLLLATAQLVRCVGFVVWVAFPGFWGFLIGLMLWGLKSATMSGAFEAVIFDDLKAQGREAEYVRVIGRTQAARFSGLVVASLVAAGVAPLGYPTLIWASFAAGVGAAAAAMTLPRAPRSMAVLKRGAAEAASLPGVPALILFIASMEAVAYAAADYWQLFGQEVGLSKPGIALFMAALAGAGAIAAAWAHRLRGLSLRGLYLLFGAAAGCVVAAAATFQVWSVVFPMIYVALFWIVDVNADARFQHALKAETRATVASVKGFAMQCGTSTLMLGFGLVAQVASYRIAFLSAGVLGLLVGGVSALRRPSVPAA